MSAVITAPSAEQKSTNVRMPWKIRAALGGLRWVDRLAPSVAARITARLFLSPSRRPRPGREHRLLSVAQGFTLNVAGERLRAWEWGRGPTVLLVHGWEGRGAQLGGFVSELVRRGYRVVAFDGPAHGDSTGRRTNVLAFAQAIAAVAERCQPLAAVVAHSFGAAATAIAMRDGLQVEQVAFVAPWAALSRAAEAFRLRVGLSARTALRMRAILERRFGVSWDKLDATTLAPAMRARLLVVHDLGDTEIPASEGRALAAAWPGGRFVSREGLGHFRILRDAGVARAVSDFLSSTPPPRRDDWNALIEPVLEFE